MPWHHLIHRSLHHDPAFAFPHIIPRFDNQLDDNYAPTRTLQARQDSSDTTSSDNSKDTCGPDYDAPCKAPISSTSNQTLPVVLGVVYVIISFSRHDLY